MSQVNISDYSGAVSGGNWQPAYQAAWDAIKANGGTINIDTQATKITTSTNFIPTTGFTVPLNFVGDGSNRVQLDGGSGLNAFYGGNHTSNLFEKFIIHGTDPENSAYTDCNNAIFAASDGLTVIDKMIFAGIKANDAVVQCYGNFSSMHVKDSKFGGCAGGPSVKMDGGNFLLVESCEFFDYQAVQDVYFSKTGVGSAAWIKAINPITQNGATDTKIAVRQCRFDEGATSGIDITGYPHVQIEQCSFNVNGGGYGIRLENVKHAIIKQCTTGYTNNDVPAIKLINCDNVIIIGQRRDHGVFRVETDSTTAPNIKLLHSTGVVIDEV